MSYVCDCEYVHIPDVTMDMLVSLVVFKCVSASCKQTNTQLLAYSALFSSESSRSNGKPTLVSKHGS